MFGKCLRWDGTRVHCCLCEHPVSLLINATEFMNSFHYNLCYSLAIFFLTYWRTVASTNSTQSVFPHSKYITFIIVCSWLIIHGWRQFGKWNTRNEGKWDAIQMRNSVVWLWDDNNNNKPKLNWNLLLCDGRMPAAAATAPAAAGAAAIERQKVIKSNIPLIIHWLECV